MSDINIRPVTDDEYPAFITAFMEGFSYDLPSKDFSRQIRQTIPPGRTLAAFDGDDIVGTFGGYDLELTVPDGVIAMEGTTIVTVFPTHRRMGLLRGMMRIHLENAAASGYPVAGLWASETDIYGRFGYGPATNNVEISMYGPDIEFRDEVDVDRVRRITAEEAAESLPSVFDRARLATPGMYARSAEWWTEEVLRDEEWMRQGKTKMRYVIHEGSNGPDGYLLYRQKAGDPEAGHANGTIHIQEFISVTSVAEASLWAYVTRIDGCPKVERWNTPVDFPLPQMVKEPRKIRANALHDALWIRILDVVGALEGRVYEENGSIVFKVSDAFRPETGGTFELAVSDGIGVCRSTTRQPDVRMEIDVLGSLYLGGESAMALAAANRIAGDDSDIEQLHRLFRTVRAPWCNQVF